MLAINCQEWAGTRLEVSLAKPPSDKKKKEDMLRKREQRMMESMAESMTRAEGMEFSAGPRGGWGGGHGGKMGYNQISTSIKPLIQDVTWTPGVTSSGAGPSGDVTKTAWIIARAGPLGGAARMVTVGGTEEAPGRTLSTASHPCPCK